MTTLENQITETRITIENLKNNREQIMITLIKKVGEGNLRSAMNILKDCADFEEQFNEGRTICNVIEEVINGDYFQIRKMKTADYIAGLNGNDSKTYALNHKK